jgi:ABC-type branched-subunit amino acid transport system substrate-binding protein
VLRDREDMDTLELRQRYGGRAPHIVQLLGDSGWLGPKLAASGGASVEGAIVVATCPGGRESVDVSGPAQAFHQAFRKRAHRGASPAALAARDGAAVAIAAARWALARPGDRGAVARALRSARLNGGVCGRAEMNAEGQLVGEVDALRIEAGEPVLLEY